MEAIAVESLGVLRTVDVLVLQVALISGSNLRENRIRSPGALDVPSAPDHRRCHLRCGIFFTLLETKSVSAVQPED